MYKLKNRILSGFMAIFLGVFTSVCPVLNVRAFDISQRGVAFMVTAKSVLTAALAAAGTIAGGAYVLDQSQLTREEQVRIRNKVGALEDQFLAQQAAKADANLKMVERVENGVKKYYPVVVSAVSNKISYVSKSFLSSWYKFLNNIGFWESSGGLQYGQATFIDGISADISASAIGHYSVNSAIGQAFSGTVFAPIPFFVDTSRNERYAIYISNLDEGYGAYTEVGVFCGAGVQSVYWVDADNRAYQYISLKSISTNIPCFSDWDSMSNFLRTGNASGVINNDVSGGINAVQQYSFGLTNNLPVSGAQDIIFPKTWIGQGINDLPFNGTTQEGLTVDSGDIPDAIPIDLGSDIPSLWEVGADVPSDVIANPADIPATGDLPWTIPDVGSIPFPIPGVAFPGAIPTEDEWPTIQDKVQTGEIASDIDVPGVGDVAIEGFPIVGNIPEEKDIEDFSDKIFPWALDKLTLPDGLFNKIPFSIPRDIYWLMQAVTAQDISGGTGQPDPSGTGVSGDVIAVDFTKSEIAWRSAPHIKGKWKFPLEKLGGKDVEVPIDIDCSQYNYFAALVWFGVAIIWTIVILRSILSSFSSM